MGKETLVKKNKKPTPKKNFMGNLEAKILDILWKQKECTVRDVVTLLKEKKAYTTVMTVMDRLFQKEILDRKMLKNGSYIYSSKQTKQSFYSQISKKVINNLIAEFGDIAVAQFIDIIESNNKKKTKDWLKKLKKVK